jgi:hypothetical protein
MHLETRKLSRFLLYFNTIDTRIPFVLIDVDAEGTVSIYFVGSPSSVLDPNIPGKILHFPTPLSGLLLQMIPSVWATPLRSP